MYLFIDSNGKIHQQLAEWYNVGRSGPIVVPNRENFEKQGYFSMCLRTTNWPARSNKLSTRNSPSKTTDTVCTNSHMKSHTRCVHTVASKLQKTIKEAKPPIILGNTLNSNSNRMSRFYRNTQGTVFNANNRVPSPLHPIVCPTK